IWRPGWTSPQRVGTVPGLFAAASPDSTQARSAPTSPANVAKVHDVVVWSPTAAASSAEPAQSIEQRSEQPSAQPQAHRRNYFVRHWRGELSLPVSYWVNNLVAAFFVYAVVIAFTLFFKDNKDIGSGTIAAALIALGCIILAVSAWQMVGVWRSAS